MALSKKSNRKAHNVIDVCNRRGEIFLKNQCKRLITCLAVPLAVGSLSAFLTQNTMETFKFINKPAFSPPGWLFPVIWTVLYIFMGIASYLVLTSGKPYTLAMTVYIIQLIFNFFWPIIFFNTGHYLFAFIWIILLWLLIFLTTILFCCLSKPAGYLMLPYLLWVTFAGYLNFSIYLLN